MIRVIGNRIILPKGDTGTFRLPISSELCNDSTIVVFSIFDKLTRKTILEKQFKINEGFVYVELEQDDTKELEPGKYWWDLKTYYMPKFNEDGELIGAMQIDSYYATHRLATFIIAEVGKDYE